MNKPFAPVPADALFAIAASLDRVADAIETSGQRIAREIMALGNGDSTRMGAVEAHSKFMGEKLDSMAEVIGDFADVLREAVCKEEGDTA
jgi:hypothetical protein